MCGFAGIFNEKSTKSQAEYLNIVSEMSTALMHRGPDSSGRWADASVGVALSHRRLSIIDVSDAGNQPMSSKSEKYILAYNGEIYNHLEIRAELELFYSRSSNSSPAIKWHGHSDTETLLAAFEFWGIEATLQKAVGMFAFALWDTQNKKVHLVRDRLGEKPLYYGWAGTGLGRALVFGSELKALKAYPGFDAPVCREALAQYLRFMYVPAPRSIYQGIFKLEPGCVLTVHGSPPVHAPAQPLRPGEAHGSVSLQRWWSLAAAVEAGTREPFDNEVEALDLLEQQLNKAVGLQSLADVPVGAFLSGGVDSSSIVALMQRQSSRPVKTFTIGFDEAGFDESPHALAVARHLGTEHYEMRVTAKTAQALIPSLPQIFDEPFADSSQIPTFLVSQAARQQVTVALSGDAGDELFGGYNRYIWGMRIWGGVSWMPISIRQTFGQLISTASVRAWDRAGAALNIGKGTGGVSRIGEKAHKLAHMLQTMKSMDDLYCSLVSEWYDPTALIQGENGASVNEPSNLLDDHVPAQGLEHYQLRMMYRDSVTYLPDDILCKVDRAAMANSLETRVPFLDHRVVELAWRIPLNMKICNGIGKWALRQVLYRYVPKELIERPKAGFAIPIGRWLRGPLRDWATALLNPVRVQQEGYLRAELIQKVWQQHLMGTHDHTAKLWAVLMFQVWLEHQAASRK